MHWFPLVDWRRSWLVSFDSGPLLWNPEDGKSRNVNVILVEIKRRISDSWRLIQADGVRLHRRKPPEMIVLNHLKVGDTVDGLKLRRTAPSEWFCQNKNHLSHQTWLWVQHDEDVNLVHHQHLTLTVSADCSQELRVSVTSQPQISSHLRFLPLKAF